MIAQNIFLQNALLGFSLALLANEMARLLIHSSTTIGRGESL
jgi:hypothetical protein